MFSTWKSSALGILSCAFFLSNCSLTTSRPVQVMSNTSAALRAAKEVQANEVEPELYQEALEWYTRARREYQFKNFREARDYAERAQELAEEAEYLALRAGAKRTAAPPDPISDANFVSAEDPGFTPSQDDNFAPQDQKKFYDEFKTEPQEPPKK